MNTTSATLRREYVNRIKCEAISRKKGLAAMMKTPVPASKVHVTLPSDPQATLPRSTILSVTESIRAGRMPILPPVVSDSPILRCQRLENLLGIALEQIARLNADRDDLQEQIDAATDRLDELEEA